MQVDNFIFTGTDRAIDGFAAYMSSRFELSQMEFVHFSVYGTVFKREKVGIHIEKHPKNAELVEYLFARDRRRMHDEPVTTAEHLFYVSTIV
jgi:hypothetical protein